jgi:prepilin-type N-terminal cleavage/methylation domain-containing protein
MTPQQYSMPARIRPSCDENMPARAQGFTLIEILICVALFAVGFASIAIVLPAGILMQKSVEKDTEGAICARNALEVMKGKGMHTLTYELIMRGQGVESTTNLVNISTLRGQSATADMEWGACNFTGGNGWMTISGAYSATDPTAPGLHGYWDTDGDQTIYHIPPNSIPNAFAWYQCGPDGTPAAGDTSGWQRLWDPRGGTSDQTSWQRGRISALKNRPIPGATLGWYSPLDFSYPSSIFDISARGYVSCVPFCNLSRTPSKDQRYVDPASNSWRLTAITLRGGQEDAAWPELNPTFGNAYMSSSAQDFRSQTAGQPGGAPFYSDTRFRGYFPGRYVARRTYGSPLLYPTDWSNTLLAGGGSCDVAVLGSSGTYNIPVPLSCPAIVYNKAKNLLLLRYPQAYAQTLDSGNTSANTTALNNYRSNQGITSTSWVDRKLKKGDKLMTVQYGYTLTVTDVLDPAKEGAALPSPNGPVDWSGGTYQIVQVTPPLNTTVFTDNVPPTPLAYNTQTVNIQAGNNGEWLKPYLWRVIVAPPPITGGESPWIASTTLDCGNNQGADAKVFRNWANLTD